MADELYGRHAPMPAFQFLGEQGAWRLDAALALLESAYYDSDASATAAMFNALVNNHPFQDGNKRYAIVATQVSLMSNGKLLVASSDEWEVLALSVARGDVDVNQLEKFFGNRLFDITLEPTAEQLQQWSDEMGREALADLERMARAATLVVEKKQGMAR